MRDDAAHVRTDKEVAKIQRTLKRLYLRSEGLIASAMKRYAKTIKAKSDELQRKIDEAETVQEKKTAEKAYIYFYQVELLSDPRFKKLVSDVSEKMYKANKNAVKVINKHIPNVYADNYNFIGAGLQGDLDGYRLLGITPEEARLYGQFIYQDIDEQKDKAWNAKNVIKTVATAAAVLYAADKIFGYTAKQVAKRNRETADRQASDMMTYSENKGRYDSMLRAYDEGFNIKKVWMATLDNRTRETHRKYDGVGAVELDYEYNTGLKKPRDPNCGIMAEVCNCRCCLVYDTGGRRSPTRAAREGIVTGSYKKDSSFSGTHTVSVPMMTYEEWMKWRSP